MCGRTFICTLLLGVLSLTVTAGKTPGLGIAAPPAAEFVISYLDGVSAGHAANGALQGLTVPTPTVQEESSKDESMWRS